MAPNKMRPLALTVILTLASLVLAPDRASSSNQALAGAWQRPASRLAEAGERLNFKFRALSQSLGRSIEAIIRPPADYFALIGRYQSWFANYSKNYPDPAQFVKGQRGQVDEELIAELDLEQDQQVDYIYQLLKRLIERLEAQSHSPSGPATSEHLTSERAKSDQHFKAAAERAKKILWRQAQNVVRSELGEISSMSAINTLAIQLANHPSSLFGAVAPVIGMMSTASQPLIHAYLTSLQIRVAVSMINKPVAELTRAIFDKMTGRTK